MDNIITNIQSKRLAELKQKKNAYEILKNKVGKMRESLNFKSIQKINQVAMFEVNVKHTNQFILHLGKDYYAQVRGEEALQFIQRKIQNLDLQLKGIEKESENKKPNHQTQQSKLSKENSKVRLNQQIQVKGNKKIESYMQLIGEEEGQQIFNIVQIQNECDDIQQDTTEPQSKQAQEQQIQENEDDNEPDIMQSIRKNMLKELQKKVEASQAADAKCETAAVPEAKQSKTEQIAAVPPKKISKFKSDRMKEKGQ